MSRALKSLQLTPLVRSAFDPKSFVVATPAVDSLTGLTRNAMPVEVELPPSPPKFDSRFWLVVLPEGEEPKLIAHDSLESMCADLLRLDGSEICVVPFEGRVMRLTARQSPGDSRALLFDDGEYCFIDGSDTVLLGEPVVDGSGYLGRLRDMLSDSASSVSSSTQPNEPEADDFVDTFDDQAD